MFTLSIPIKSSRQLPKLRFPETCLHCGKPRTGTRPLSLDVGSGKRKSISLELEPPLCQACLTLESRVEWVSLIAFAVSALFWAVVGFLVGLFVLPNLSLWSLAGITGMQLSEAVMVLSGLSALIAAVAGGTLTELGLRVLALPVLGGIILKRPLTLLGLFQERHDVVGLSARLTNNKKTLLLTFEREDAAREFAHLNNLPLGG